MSISDLASDNTLVSTQIATVPIHTGVEIPPNYDIFAVLARRDLVNDAVDRLPEFRYPYLVGSEGLLSLRAFSHGVQFGLDFPLCGSRYNCKMGGAGKFHAN